MKEKLDEYVRGQAEDLVHMGQEFPSEITMQWAEKFIRQIISENKPRVSRQAWLRYSEEMDGEMPLDYYRGANRVFEWLKEILGVEVEDES